MKLLPVALALFYRQSSNELEVWVQKRTDDGPFHGLLEFPGGGIEADEVPLTAAVREVEEEVGIVVSEDEGVLLGVYSNETATKTVLLYVFLFPDQKSLVGKGSWLTITQDKLSSPYLGLIPPPNHRIIDDLYKNLYDGAHE